MNRLTTTIGLIIILFMLSLVFARIARSDYDRLTQVERFEDGSLSVKVVYDKVANVNCYVTQSRNTWDALGISCLSNK